MTNILKQHLDRYIKIDSDQFNEIIKYFEVLEVKKKEDLLVKGRICRSNYFVAEGCLRMYFINDKGSEETTEFAIENWWLADYTSFQTQKPSLYNIQAVEKSNVLAITFKQQEKLLHKIPVMERYFRLIHQRAHAAAQNRIRMLYDLSREEFYNTFKERYPEFVNRVPQYLIASFLGFTPEYLSELRAKKRS